MQRGYKHFCLHIIHTINKDMENTFLTEEQQQRLNDLNWSVFPNGAYIILYNDEISNRAWYLLCKQLGVSTEVESITVLCAGVQ
jgi:hypothetical protein